MSNQHVKTHLFFNFTLLRYYAASSVSIPHRRFGTTYRVPFSSLPIYCPATSARIYHYSLRNNSEEHSSHLFRGVSFKSSPPPLRFIVRGFAPKCLLQEMGKILLHLRRAELINTNRGERIPSLDTSGTHCLPF